MEGRTFDRISYVGGAAVAYAPVYGDHWHTQPYKESVTFSLSAGLLPVGAGGSLANDDVLTYPADCDFTIPPDIPPDNPPEDCTEAWCLAARGAVGGASCPMSVGNPINASNGNKFQLESDFIGVGSVNLRFERFYNSHWSTGAGSMGAHWRTTFDRSLVIDLNAKMIRVNRQDGKVVIFRSVNDVWTHGPEVNGDLKPVSLPELPLAAWRVNHQSDEEEFYDALGRLIQIRLPGGQSRTCATTSLVV
ncbi:DUF6531 domain-containing protein [Massilia sp. B-10]|nr:DUF6531 domain-containing protein [Massilia sp. B-10]